jgi:predicted AAA+ superfamily ATPase
MVRTPASPTGYITRVVDRELDELLPHLPAISLEGPKGVGKTATAARRSGSIRRLDDPAELEIIHAQPTRLIKGSPPIVIDEWQRYPASWDLVRRAVDADPFPGRFLLTGSSTPSEKPTHSGAGRIVPLRMRPLTLLERGLEAPSVSLIALLSGHRIDLDGSTILTLDDYAREIVAGGFPGMRFSNARAQRAALDGYLSRIVDVDLPELGVAVRHPTTLWRWLRAFAAATATNASYEKIRNAATGSEHDTPAKTTTVRYREALQRIWILDDLDAWTPTRNHLSRLVAAPKHHLADPALAARLLGLDVGALLSGEGPDALPRDGAFLGSLFESLATQTVRVLAQAAEAQVAHLRTMEGKHEIDLIVVRGDGRVVALEVKLSSTVDERSVRHLRWLQETLGDDLLDAVVLTTGSQAYRRADGIGVVPLALLGP